MNLFHCFLSWFHSDMEWGQALSWFHSDTEWGQALSLFYSDTEWGQALSSFHSDTEWGQALFLFHSDTEWGQALSLFHSDMEWGQALSLFHSDMEWGQAQQHWNYGSHIRKEHTLSFHLCTHTRTRQEMRLMIRRGRKLSHLFAGSPRPERNREVPDSSRSL